jgi:hypothetical protein
MSVVIVKVTPQGQYPSHALFQSCFIFIFILIITLFFCLIIGELLTIPSSFVPGVEEQVDIGGTHILGGGHCYNEKGNFEWGDLNESFCLGIMTRVADSLVSCESLKENIILRSQILPFSAETKKEFLRLPIHFSVVSLRPFG